LEKKEKKIKKKKNQERDMKLKTTPKTIPSRNCILRVPGAVTVKVVAAKPIFEEENELRSQIPVPEGQTESW